MDTFGIGTARKASRWLPIATLVLLHSPSHAANGMPTLFVEEQVLAGLNSPVSMAFLPDGRLLVTERELGRVRMVMNAAGAAHFAATDPVLTVGDVFSDDLERGLEGIAVDPRWPTFPYLYVCYTKTGNRMALVRYTGVGQLNNGASENLVFTTPLVLLNDLFDEHQVHNGLGLRFAKDGRLLMSTGDDGNRCNALDPSTRRGALLRLEVSGLGPASGGPVLRALLTPPDNPLAGPDSNARLVYAYGFRNPWRFHVDPVTGDILLADVGEDSCEELDEVLPGENYGWPYREGALVRTPDCGPEGGPYRAPIVAQLRSAGYQCISTAGVYRPIPGAVANWPQEYWGNLFYGDVFANQLRRLVRSGGGWIAAPAALGQPTEDDWCTTVNIGVDFAVGPDASLYWLKLWDEFGNQANGMLRRIRYTGTPIEVPPSASIPSSFTAAPNPFRGQVELAWRTQEPGPTTIEIFDVGGRRVRRLGSGMVGSEGRWTWNGLDESGGRTAPGLYLARLSGPGWARSLRLARVD